MLLELGLPSFNTLIHNYFKVIFSNRLSACDNVLVQRVLQFNCNVHCALHAIFLFLIFCRVGLLLFCLCACVCVCGLCAFCVWILVVWFKINGWMDGLYKSTLQCCYLLEGGYLPSFNAFTEPESGRTRAWQSTTPSLEDIFGIKPARTRPQMKLIAETEPR